MQELYAILTDIIPSKMQQMMMSISSALGFLFGYVFDGLSAAFLWLCIFVAVDYVTGIIQAVHNKAISSKVGFRGILKKLIILSLVILFHGLAQIVEFPALETAVIFAFAINEIYSILENIERAGYGEIVPPGVRQILAIVENDKLKNFKK